MSQTSVNPYGHEWHTIESICSDLCWILHLCAPWKRIYTREHVAELRVTLDTINST